MKPRRIKCKYCGFYCDSPWIVEWPGYPIEGWAAALIAWYWSTHLVD